jgi:hypothetical protein
MHKPYMPPVSGASPDIKLREPRISKPLIGIIKVLARFYLFMFYGVARVVLRGGKDFFGAFQRALEGKSRLIIAFRHPNGGEPQLLSWFILFKLRRLAASAGYRFPRFPHAVFVYGFEVVRWGGWVARFVMPNLGAMPIHHSKLDRQGMSRIFQAIVGGTFPVALAPEGQVSYTTDGIPRLEQGVIRIGFTAAERLAGNESGKTRAPGPSNPPPLEILPVAVHSRFGPWGKLTLEWLIRKIEKYTCTGGRNLSISRRLTASRDHLLKVNEERYGLSPGPALSYEKRMDAVIDAALETGERLLGVKTGGDVFSRLYELRQICWDRIVLPGVNSFARFSGVERGIKDLQAGEAWHAGRHLELVDLAWYFRSSPPDDQAPLHHIIEYAQNLWDFANRTMGGSYTNRISIFPRRVIIQAAPVLNLSERLPAYQKNKKAAIARALQDLEDSFLQCIAEVNKVE